MADEDQNRENKTNPTKLGEVHCVGLSLPKLPFNLRQFPLIELPSALVHGIDAHSMQPVQRAQYMTSVHLRAAICEEPKQDQEEAGDRVYRQDSSHLSVQR